MPDGVLTLLDEAYIDYVVEKEYPDGLDDFRKGRNVLVLRTFSKIYGLAGIRIGYGIAKTSVLAEMNKIRSPFNTSSIAQAAALGALADDEYRALSRGRNLEEMRFLEAGLRARGVDFTPSAGNFVLVHTDLPGGVWYQALLRQGVIVRPVGAYALPNAFRVSVGNREENELFFSAWDAVAAAGGPPRG